MGEKAKDTTPILNIVSPKQEIVLDLMKWAYHREVKNLDAGTLRRAAYTILITENLLLNKIKEEQTGKGEIKPIYIA